MANDAVVDPGRRRFLTATTSVVGGAGVVLAAIPFVKSWEPSAAAKSAGAPVLADIGKIEAGQKVTFAWRGLPVFVVNRTKPQLDGLAGEDARLKDPKSENADQQPKYAQNENRSIKPEWLVVIGICTHLGCVPDFFPELKPEPFDPNWKGGFYCPCHKSRYDMSGRVFDGVPAPANLAVPKYSFVDDTHIMIGVDPAEGEGVMGTTMTRIQSKSAVINWIEDRLPVFSFLSSHTSGYYAPKNFNLWYYFGSLALLVLVNQILTGIFLTMNYTPSTAEVAPGTSAAFASVEYIMRDVSWGWLIRYMHSTGASLFFVVVYLHMFRGLMYGSYKKPRELVWLLGMLIFLVLMAEAFMGYVLPWGNMSFWGAKVIVSLFGAVPWVGDALVEWIMGDYLPANATLNRFFALHVIALPLVLLLLVVLHLAALHEVGSNNPDGVEIKEKKKPDGTPLDGIAFHPYYTVKDLFGTGFFLLIAAFIIFYAPTFGGWFLEHDNFIPANNLATPSHIKPSWYFTPFYAIVRMIPFKLPGVIAMFGSIVLLFFVPWLDRGKVKSIRYRGTGYKIALGLFAASFVMLATVGAGVTSEVIPEWFGTSVDVTTVENLFGRFWMCVYFGFFLFLYVYTRFGFEKTKAVPDRVTMHD